MDGSFRGGRASGICTALGVSTGQLIWAVATSVGLGAVLLASEPVFRAVRLAGAAYLIWLGIQSLRTAFRRRGPWAPARRRAGSWGRARRSFRAS